MVSRLALVCVLSCLAMAGCASKPPSGLEAAKTAYAPVAGKPSLPGRDRAGDGEDPAFAAFRNAPGRKSFGSLAGRTLKVSSISEIRLADKEVILTFDDGPIPGKTDQVLATLRQYGVKATFLMVGQMASNYPAIGFASEHIAVLTGGCGAAAKSSDEIGRLGAEIMQHGRIIDDVYGDVFRPVFRN